MLGCGSTPDLRLVSAMSLVDKLYIQLGVNVDGYLLSTISSSTVTAEQAQLLPCP
jgi:hypothetical protein